MVSRAFVGGLVLAAGTALSIGAASAADLPAAPPMAPTAPVAYAPQVYNWSGIYFGGHIGGGYSGSSWSDPISGTGNDNFNSWGFLGGAQLGANYQVNRLVFGVEGDWSWTNINNKGTDSIGDALNTNLQWTSTVTGRIGAAFDRFLVYGKGGLALAQDQSTLTDVLGNASSTSMLRTGWTAGAGIEYDYLGFGSQAMNFTTPVVGTVSSNASLNVQEIKAGINFRFGGGQ